MEREEEIERGKRRGEEKIVTGGKGKISKKKESMSSSGIFVTIANTQC